MRKCEIVKKIEICIYLMIKKNYCVYVMLKKNLLRTGHIYWTFCKQLLCEFDYCNIALK